MSWHQKAHMAEAMWVDWGQAQGGKTDRIAFPR